MPQRCLLRHMHMPLCQVHLIVPSPEDAQFLLTGMQDQLMQGFGPMAALQDRYASAMPVRHG
jgi:hypothetical protein